MAGQSKGDRLSLLPEEILINILSKMPISDGCRTGALSRKWQKLWTHVFNVCFFEDFDAVVERNLGPEEGFFSFVDCVLSRCTSSWIRRFWIQFRIPVEADTSQVNRWIRFAVDRNADDVILMQQEASYPIAVPENLLSHLALKGLKLKYFRFPDEYLFNWPNLTTLTLFSVRLSNEAIARLLQGCPALETLELTHYGYFRELRIQSPRLKKLVLESCFPLQLGYNYGPWLDVHAPHLLKFEVYGAVDCRLLNASSLVEAIFDCEMRLYFVHDFLASAHQATRLSLSPWFLEALSVLDFNKLCAVNFNCKELELHGHIMSYNISGIATFLLALPHLATLDVYLGSMALFKTPLIFTGEDYDNANYNVNFVPQNYMKVVNAQSVPMEPSNEEDNGVMNSLTEVKFFHGYWCCADNKLDELSSLGKLVLKMARHLERMYLIAKKGWECKMCSRNCGSEFLSKLALLLEGCPRLSFDAHIHFIESS